MENISLFHMWVSDWSLTLQRQTVLRNSCSFTCHHYLFYLRVRVGLWRKLSTEELMLLNCGVGEYSWESLVLQRDPTRDWGQEEKGTTEDEMAGWHHQLYGHEFKWTPGVGNGQGGLPCSDSWGHKESDTTEQLNWIELNWVLTSSLYLLTVIT